MDERTMKYYNDNYKDIYKSSKNIDLSSLYLEFEKYLEYGDKILDLGCGIGRDIEYFKKNYEVEGVDASKKLVEIARKNTGVKIYNLTYEKMEFKDSYDGIWALASLVHMGEEKIIETIRKVSKSLNKQGVFYMSFKHGDFKGYIGERYFTYMNEDKINNMFIQIPEVEVIKIFYTGDKMDRKDTEWINIICKKMIISNNLYEKHRPT